MNRKRDHFILTLIYLFGINVYYALWYLGSEGLALEWGEPGLDFWSHWLAANLGSLSNAVILIFLISTFDKKQQQLDMPKLATLILFFSLFCFGVLFSLILTVHAYVYQAESILQFFSSKAFVSISVYHLVVAGLMMLLHLAVMKNGGVVAFFSQLFKRKAHPRPVDRGFAFIDLNDSTGIAENLGHHAYSELLRACFSHLEGILAEFPDFEVYQYVGDEAVITWRVDSGSSENALAFYQKFTSTLEGHRAWFNNRFGLMPTFKCAIHTGEVMESELGAKRPQTAYHGDVLNMANRILNLCHDYQTSLLVSQEYKKLIPDKLFAGMAPIEHEFVNGRSRKMCLYKPIARSEAK